MNLNLPTEAHEFVKGLVAQGRYQSEEAAVVDGLRLLMGREKLRNEVRIGIHQLDHAASHDEEAVFAEVDLNLEIVRVQRGDLETPFS